MTPTDEECSEGPDDDGEGGLVSRPGTMWCHDCGTFLPMGGHQCSRCREGKSHPSNMNEDRDNDS